MDEVRSILCRAGRILLTPIALVLFLTVVPLLAAAYYLRAIGVGLWDVLIMPFRPPPKTESILPSPHFLERARVLQEEDRL